MNERLDSLATHAWTLAAERHRLSTLAAPEHERPERVDESDSERRGAVEAERQRQWKVVGTTLCIHGKEPHGRRDDEGASQAFHKEAKDDVGFMQIMQERSLR